ncbi:hypothetical protein [Corynebacterium sp. HS2168-gen11]|uniref:hypothetical protein n=1 Tax=Corynebacterium sp. HS2168-gen11 TaxID=2974027 RepID=UPI00216AD86A|nr:hypothetical protein [Corynebacterium sp. HS2168-gen11]MCS4535950.1 hypothetical protein [Corynebacterium sp. HS2168-gen11]
MARKNIPLRIDPVLYDAIARLAAENLLSVNAQIELLLRDNLRAQGRLPKDLGQLPKRGRPRKTTSAE